jgi:ubiquinone/menaquinone biosynthesis C-methylase UbiE
MPVPADKDRELSVKRSARFWDRVAERYARRPLADEAAYRKKLEIAREYFRADMQVLEIGCGTGMTAIAHAPYVAHIRATDASAKMLEIARRRAAAANVRNLSFEQAFAEDLEVAEGSIDAVLAMSVLHLLDDPGSVLASVHRMLRPGGILVSNTVCLADKSRWIRLVARLGGRLGLLPSIRFLARNEVEDALVAAGFEILRAWRPDDGLAVFIVARSAVTPFGRVPPAPPSEPLPE